MPDIISAYPLFILVIIISMGADIYAASNKRYSLESVTTTDARLGDLVLFLPFSALYFHEDFWVNLGLTLPLILLATGIQFTLYNRGYLRCAPEILATIPGSYLLTIIGYFIFFHEGILIDDSSASNSPDLAQDPVSYKVIYWPYISAIVLFLFTIISKQTDSICLSLLFFIPAITALPFFTNHYWWNMLAGFILFLISVNRMFRVMDKDHIGGVSVMSGYFYMMAAFGSIIIYAIFF